MICMKIPELFVDVLKREDFWNHRRRNFGREHGGFRLPGTPFDYIVDLGSWSFTLTRNKPSLISCCRSATFRLREEGIFDSKVP